MLYTRFYTYYHRHSVAIWCLFELCARFLSSFLFVFSWFFRHFSSFSAHLHAPKGCDPRGHLLLLGGCVLCVSVLFIVDCFIVWSGRKLCADSRRLIRLFKFDFVVEIFCGDFSLIYSFAYFYRRLYAHNKSLRLSILSTSSHFTKCVGAMHPSQSVNIWGVSTSSSLPKRRWRYTEVEQGSVSFLHC